MDVVKEWFTTTLPEWLKTKMWVLPNWSWVAIALVAVILIIAIAAICARKRKKARQEASKPVLMETTAAEPAEKAEEVEPKTADVQPQTAKDEATVTVAVEEVIAPPEEEKPAAVNAEVKKSETAVPENKEVKMEEKPAMAENKPATKPAAKATAKPAAKATTKTETKSAEKKTEAKTAAKPVEKKTEKPAAKPVEKKEVKQSAKPAEKKTEKPATKPAPAAKAAAKPVAEKTPAANATHKDDNDDKVYHISKRKEDRMWQVKAEGSSRALKKFFTQEEAVEYAKNVAKNNEGRIVIHKVDGSFKKLKY